MREVVLAISIGPVKAMVYRQDKVLDQCPRSLLLACLVLLSACTSQQLSLPEKNLAPLTLASGQSLTMAESLAKVAPVDPLQLNDVVSELAAENIDPEQPPKTLVADISRLIVSPAYLGVRYDAGVTGTAVEVYQSGVANCLGFSHLFIALARSAGLDAHYQQVEVKPRWQKQGEWLLVGMHVNVTGSVNSRRFYTADIDTTTRYHTLKKYRISDATALGQHYNNLAMDALLDGNLTTAYANLARAIQTAPGQPHLWTNLGTLYKKNGQLEQAQASYQQALELDDDYLAAMEHLARLFTLRGDAKSAETYRRRVQLYRVKNPYYHAHLAQQAAERGDWNSASRAIKKAIALKEDEFDFYLAAYQYSAQAGNERAARAFFTKASGLAEGKQRSSLALLEEQAR